MDFSLGLGPVFSALSPVRRAMTSRAAKTGPCKQWRIRLAVRDLRRVFDRIGSETDENGVWLALKDAAHEVDRLGLPHPVVAAGRDVWRVFLQRLIQAAEKGDVSEAAQIIEGDDLRPYLLHGSTTTPTAPPIDLRDAEHETDV